MDNKEHSTVTPSVGSGDGAAKPKWRPSEKELTLRFMCPACRHLLTVPLRSLGIDETCPACAQRVRIPTLDRTVVGLDVVRRFLVAEAKATSTTPPPSAGRASAAGQTAEAPPATTSAATQSRATNARTSGQGGAPNPTPPPPPVPPASPRARSPADGKHAAHHQRFDADAAGTAAKDAARRLVEFVDGVVASLLRSPRRVRYAVAYGIWLGPIALLGLPALVGIFTGDEESLAIGIMGVLCLGSHWFVLGSWISRWSTPHILAALYPTVRCPCCQDDLPLHGLWHCGCGYHDHRERHIMRYRCPKCRDRIGHFDCPRCDATILL